VRGEEPTVAQVEGEGVARADDPAALARAVGELAAAVVADVVDRAERAAHPRDEHVAAVAEADAPALALRERADVDLGPPPS